MFLKVNEADLDAHKQHLHLNVSYWYSCLLYWNVMVTGTWNRLYCHCVSSMFPVKKPKIGLHQKRREL